MGGFVSGVAQTTGLRAVSSAETLLLAGGVVVQVESATDWIGGINGIVAS